VPDLRFQASVRDNIKPKRVSVEKGALAGIPHKEPDVINLAERDVLHVDSRAFSSQASVNSIHDQSVVRLEHDSGSIDVDQL
jgi:hypothetical protein